MNKEKCFRIDLARTNI